MSKMIRKSKPKSAVKKIIGIMGAMPEEINRIHLLMTDQSTVRCGDGEYYCGKIGAHDVVLVSSGWGKVAASCTAAVLCSTFKIDQLIFTGVAGAASSDLNIGDIVISSQAYQHDVDARPFMPQHEIPQLGITFFKADSALVKAAEAAAKDLISSLSQKIPSELIDEFNLTQPKCIIGTIATGDQFISDPAKREAILKEKPETSAFEMEGAAAAQVCFKFQTPFVVIRTISDAANHLSKEAFEKFIQKIASYYSEHIVSHMIMKM